MIILEVDGKNGTDCSTHKEQRVAPAAQCAPRYAKSGSSTATPKFVVRNITDERARNNFADALDDKADDDDDDSPAFLKYATACVKSGTIKSKAGGKPNTMLRHQEEADACDTIEEEKEDEKPIPVQINYRPEDNCRDYKRQIAYSDNPSAAPSKRLHLRDN